MNEYRIVSVPYLTINSKDQLVVLFKVRTKQGTKEVVLKGKKAEEVYDTLGKGDLYTTNKEI